MTMQQLYLVVPMVPLVAAIVVGLWGRKMPRAASHYAAFLDLWSDADAALQPKVEDAKRRLAAIEAKEAR